MKIFKKIFFLFIGAVTVLIIALGLDIGTYPREATRESADAAIVLGAAIWTDKPSPVFRERLNHAADLYRNGKIKKVILTGGFGEQEKFSEAEIGEKYLIEQGIPGSDIFKENKSRNTFQNLELAAPIVFENNLSTVLIVSDPLHLRRAVLMAHKVGINAYPSPTPTTRYQSLSSQLSFLLREIYFYFIYLIFGL